VNNSAGAKGYQMDIEQKRKKKLTPTHNIEEAAQNHREQRPTKTLVLHSLRIWQQDLRPHLGILVAE